MRAYSVAIIFLVLLYSIHSFEVDGQTCYCNSCEDCSNAINGLTCTKVVLEEDMYEVRDPTCIVVNTDVKNKEFDCDYKMINADSTFNITGFLIAGENIEIKNCLLGDFANAFSITGNGTKVNNVYVEYSKTAFSIAVERGCILENIEINFSKNGIKLVSSDLCEIKNVYLYNVEKGITTITSKNLDFKNLFIINSTRGLFLTENSLFAYIFNSTFINNSQGLIISSDRVMVNSSNFTNNDVAIQITSRDGKIINSTFDNNKISVSMKNVRGFRIYDNIFTTGTVFSMENSFKNYIYNNIINSTSPLETIDVSRALWNVSLEKGENIIGYDSYGGNYWTTPEGKGYSDLCKDTDNNAVCDNPNQINRNNVDFIALTVPVDLDVPFVKFEQPTPEDGSIIFSDNFTVNVSASDRSGISTIFIRASRIDGKFFDYMCLKEETCFYTFSDLDEGAYFVNATAYDKYKNSNSTETILLYIKKAKDSISYSIIFRYFPLAVIAGMIAIIVKEVLDISIIFLKKINR